MYQFAFERVWGPVRGPLKGLVFTAEALLTVLLCLLHAAHSGVLWLLKRFPE